MAELSETLKKMTTSSSADYSVLANAKDANETRSTDESDAAGPDASKDANESGCVATESQSGSVREEPTAGTVPGEQRRSHGKELPLVASNDAILPKIASVRPSP